MQSQISLNAIRIFATVTKEQSIAGAATVLGVTPSAVSHQVKNLEIALATALFKRSNNAIALTRAGIQFLDDVTPGLRMLEQASAVLLREANEITVRVSATLAVRWLVPALQRFKELYPNARVRIETSFIEETHPGPSVDMVITYRRLGNAPSEGEKILTDFSRPVLAPNLLQNSGYKNREDITSIPAIICTDNNWDWQLWSDHFEVPINKMSFTDQFDMDDTALHAAIAGLGMVLAPSLMTMSELKVGSLVTLPDVEPIELGAFYLLQGPRTNAMTRAFRKWLLSELAAVSA